MWRSSERDFDCIVLRCIQKRPEDRYQTPGELLADLEAFLAGEPLPSTTGGAVPVVHTPNASAARTAPAAQRSRLLPALAGALVLMILCAAAALLLKNRSASSRPSQPDANRRPARESVPESLDADLSAPEETAAPGGLARPSSKALDDAGIMIVDRETDSQTQSYFDDARKAAEQALRDGAGFRKAIDDLGSFSSTPYPWW